MAGLYAPALSACQFLEYDRPVIEARMERIDVRPFVETMCIHVLRTAGASAYGDRIVA